MQKKNCLRLVGQHPETPKRRSPTLETSQGRTHLEVAVDDGRLAVVQPRNGLADVAENGQHFLFGETDLQPLVHQLQHVRPE